MTSWKHKLALTAQRNRQEIVKAKLDRREMMRLGLLTAGGALIAKAGLSSRAFGQVPPTLTDPDATLSRNPASPPCRPWVQPMPRLPVLAPVLPHDMEYGECDGTTPIDGATKRIQHQYFSYTPPANGAPNGTYGANPVNPAYNFAPQKFYELEMKESYLQLHPDYAKTRFFAFNEHVPGPLIKAKYGEPIVVRYKNKLPPVTVPQNFGIAEMTTHLHNGHTPSESDGNPVNYFNSCNSTSPIEHDASGNVVIDPATGQPKLCNPYGFKDQHYPNVYAGFRDPQYGPAGNPNEALGSLWYHDHHLDFTAQNVYKGMFGCYNLFDALDNGDETSRPGSTNPGLGLPSGDYDIPIFFHDALFDSSCRTDGNLLPNAVQVSSVRIAVAERVDIIVDFAKTKANRLYFVNRAEQINGRGPTGKTLSPGTPVLQVNIGAAVPDPSADPAAGAAGNVGMKLRDLPEMDFAALQAKAAKLPVRTWRFERGSGGWMVNGKFFDENVVNASIPMGSEEVWVIQNPGGSWRHPVHIHYEEHRMLTRNGTPVKPNTQLNGAIDYARRDVVNLQTNDETRLFMRFRDMKGRYVMHCHNVVHEDHAMMIRWDMV